MYLFSFSNCTHAQACPLITLPFHSRVPSSLTRGLGIDLPLEDGIAMNVQHVYFTHKRPQFDLSVSLVIAARWKILRANHYTMLSGREDTK